MRESCRSPLANGLIKQSLLVQKQGRATTELLALTDEESLIRPNQISAITSELQNCSSLLQGQLLHYHIVFVALEENIFIANLILRVYGLWGRPDDAKALFIRIHNWDKFSWNFIIRACAWNGNYEDSLLLFYSMLGEGFLPDKFLYPSILSVCREPADLGDGKLIHGYIKMAGYEGDIFVANALITMYGNCGGLEDARAVFDNMEQKDVISWNSIIHAYAQNDCGFESLCLYKQMRSTEEPNKVTLVTILSAFENSMNLSDAKYIHAEVKIKGLETDILVGNTVINMYTKCNSLCDAKLVFDEMEEHDVVSWNSVIKATVQNGENYVALQYFRRMQQEGSTPNKATFTSVLLGCSNGGLYFEGKFLHSCISFTKFSLDLSIMSPLVTLYCKFGPLKEAHFVFNVMQERNNFCWNDMIAAHAQHGNNMLSLKLFHKLQDEGLLPDMFIFSSAISSCSSQETILEGKRLHSMVLTNEFDLDVVIGTALINMYGKGGTFEEARYMFQKMPQRNAHSWSSMASVSMIHNRPEDVLESFDQMCSQAVLPNKAVFVNLVVACTHLTQLKAALQLHVCILHSEINTDVVLGTALVDMYGKCGHIENASNTFKGMQERNILAWNVILNVYAQHGYGINALKTVQAMVQDRVLPDKTTYLSLIYACSHSGLLDETIEYFVCLNYNHNYDILPHVDHLNCVLDALSRAGRIEDAERLLDTAPFHPTVTSWITLLSCYRDFKDAERGEQTAAYGWELDLEVAGPYIVLSNLLI